MSEPAGFHPNWEAKYQSGHGQRYPWDVVVSFVFRHSPKDVPRNEIGIVEVGCGTGANLWFAAREGFRVAGIDGSATAITAARGRFAAENLAGTFEVGDFTKPLPWLDEEFDLAIDRAALTCCSDADMIAALAEIRRVLKTGGRLLTVVYGDTHSSRGTGKTLASGLTVEMRGGSAVGIAALRFYSQAELERIFGAGGWAIRSLDHLQVDSWVDGTPEVHAEYRAVLEKMP